MKSGKTEIQKKEKKEIGQQKKARRKKKKERNKEDRKTNKYAIANTTIRTAAPISKPKTTNRERG